MILRTASMSAAAVLVGIAIMTAASTRVVVDWLDLRRVPVDVECCAPALFPSAAPEPTFLPFTASPSKTKAASSIAAATVRRIEQQIVMPRGAAPLELYDRYYAESRRGDRRVVVGVLLLRSVFSRMRQAATPVPGIANVYTTTAEGLPWIHDGGCIVVTVYFDIATQRLLPVHGRGADAGVAECNGMA